jgi:hypothetical protein
VAEPAHIQTLAEIDVMAGNSRGASIFVLNRFTYVFVIVSLANGPPAVP